MHVLKAARAAGRGAGQGRPARNSRQAGHIEIQLEGVAVVFHGAHRKQVHLGGRVGHVQLGEAVVAKARGVGAQVLAHQLVKALGTGAQLAGVQAAVHGDARCVAASAQGRCYELVTGNEGEVWVDAKARGTPGNLGDKVRGDELAVAVGEGREQVQLAAGREGRAAKGRQGNFNFHPRVNGCRVGGQAGGVEVGVAGAGQHRRRRGIRDNGSGRSALANVGVGSRSWGPGASCVRYCTEIHIVSG